MLERSRKKQGMRTLQHVLRSWSKVMGLNLRVKLRTKFEKFSELGWWAVQICWGPWKSTGNGIGCSQQAILSLRHFRDQLPQELVDAYDKFQEQVDSYLSLVQNKKALEKEERRAEDKEEWNMLRARLRIWRGCVWKLMHQ